MNRFKRLFFRHVPRSQSVPLGYVPCWEDHIFRDVTCVLFGLHWPARWIRRLYWWTFPYKSTELDELLWQHEKEWDERVHNTIEQRRQEGYAEGFAAGAAIGAKSERDRFAAKVADLIAELAREYGIPPRGEGGWKDL